MASDHLGLAPWSLIEEHDPMTDEVIISAVTSMPIGTEEVGIKFQCYEKLNEDAEYWLIPGIIGRLTYSSNRSWNYFRADGAITSDKLTILNYRVNQGAVSHTIGFQRTKNELEFLMANQDFPVSGEDALKGTLQTILLTQQLISYYAASSVPEVFMSARKVFSSQLLKIQWGAPDGEHPVIEIKPGDPVLQKFSAHCKPAATHMEESTASPPRPPSTQEPSSLEVKNVQFLPTRSQLQIRGDLINRFTTTHAVPNFRVTVLGPHNQFIASDIVSIIPRTIVDPGVTSFEIYLYVRDLQTSVVRVEVEAVPGSNATGVLPPQDTRTFSHAARDRARATEARGLPSGDPYSAWGYHPAQPGPELAK
jgi:hypothetical protein